MDERTKITKSLYSNVIKQDNLPVHNWYLIEYEKIPSEFILRKNIDYKKFFDKYKDKIIFSSYSQNGEDKPELTSAVIKLDDEGTILSVKSPMEYNVSYGGSGIATLKKSKDGLEEKKSEKKLTGTILFSKTISEIEGLINSLPFVKPKKEPNKLYLLSQDSFGFFLKSIDVDYKKVNIDLNYNDDLQEINNIIIKGLKSTTKGNNKGLVLLYGLPGAGKTTYIRSLVSKIRDKKFVLVPNNMVAQLSSPMLLNFLSTTKDLILVLEESEKTLVKRDEYKDNSSISNILNISDGLLGDCLNFKIIATFNTGLENVDDALLRKGRLLAKYEFKELESKKAFKLKEKVGATKEVSNLLADIYNSNDVSFVKTKRKIGFSAAIN